MTAPSPDRYRWTRISFFYLAGYLLGGGLAMLATPRLALELLQANEPFAPAVVRTLGMLMLGLAIVVIQIIRHRLVVLYPTTLAIRSIFAVTLLALYLDTRDPFFVVILAIVGLGMILTLTAYQLDRRAIDNAQGGSTAPAVHGSPRGLPR